MDSPNKQTLIPPRSIAVWALTASGANLATRLKKFMSQADLFLPQSIADMATGAKPFNQLRTHVAQHFHNYGGHIFIMASGIVVRIIASHLMHKTHDPAVVVMDELGNHAISLVSGHIGGANALARSVAGMVNAIPVITTATDINELPAIDILATAANLRIDNPDAIKIVSMAFLRGQTVRLHDPQHYLTSLLPEFYRQNWFESMSQNPTDQKPCEFSTNLIKPRFDDAPPGIYIDDQMVDLPPDVLVLRPPSLAVGLGCNRHTPMQEIMQLLRQVFTAHSLSMESIGHLASIEIKKDEAGLLQLAETLGVPLQFFNRKELSTAKGVATPSAMVKKHVGVTSVCEAAAILATNGGSLIVTKQKSPNVTVAVARKPMNA